MFICRMHWKIGIVLAAGVALILAWAYHVSPAGEPTYQGRPLGEWLLQYELASKSAAFTQQRGSAVRAQCKIAVKAIGTNAIPFLLTCAMAPSRSVTEDVTRLLGLSPRWKLQRFSPYEMHYMACNGFSILGADASSAAPFLARLLNNRDPLVRFRALVCLQNVQCECAIPSSALEKLRTDSCSAISILASNITSVRKNTTKFP